MSTSAASVSQHSGNATSLRCRFAIGVASSDGERWPMKLGVAFSQGSEANTAATSSSCPMPSSGSVLVFLRSALRRIEFHRFLIALSVRPGKLLTISDQRVPSSWTLRTIAASSCAVHSALFTSGDRWLCQRSRHCLPERPFICAPTADHRTLPPSSSIVVTSWWSVSSSAAFQMCFFHVPAGGVDAGRSLGVPLPLGAGLPMLLAVPGPIPMTPTDDSSVSSETSIFSAARLSSGISP
mmetsp:Transcript_68447/g.152788  ORF Transcript_68447/g.152788 Transcript_68447/m.152788 type:complete len:239 (-) Transcript_68447:105-821(-)